MERIEGRKWHRWVLPQLRNDLKAVSLAFSSRNIVHTGHGCPIDQDNTRIDFAAVCECTVRCRQVMFLFANQAERLCGENTLKTFCR